MTAKQYFRRPVPSGGNEFSQFGFLVIVPQQSPWQSKIAQSNLAVGIDQDIGRLNIPVHKAGRMNILKAFGYLIDDIFLVQLIK